MAPPTPTYSAEELARRQQMLDIAREELNYDYGFSYDSDYKDFPCRCQSKNCCGYIVRSESRWRINKKFKKNIRINR